MGFKKPKIDQYFLSERCPYSGRRQLNWKVIKLVAFGSLGVMVLFLLFAVPSTDKASATGRTSVENSIPPAEVPPSADYLPHSTWRTVKPAGSQSVTRQYSASQLVSRNGVGDNLPVGTTIPVKLVNTVLSMEQSPVIAEVVQDIFWQNEVIIPTGTRAIGQASDNDGTERLQARFQNLVFPSGEEHGLSALAVMTDGSSGIVGNYHSRTLEKQGGRFLGNFVGGLSEGMAEKQSSGGQYGIVFEPGSLTNGILNGLAASSFDQAKVFAEGAQNVHPFIEVKTGTPFLLYLEQDYRVRER